MAELNVWMNGSRVGVWFALRTGTPAFRYFEDWARKEEGRALSLSLPFTGTLEHRGAAVENYFDNLLPENPAIRRRLRRRFRARTDSPFDLLTAIGRDCVGAVQLLPPDMEPEGWNRIEAGPRLSEGDVEGILASVTSDAPLGQADDDEGLRISIAGAQEKTALLKMGKAWHRPRGATPTTHILKLPLGLVGNMRADMSDSVENEWLCAQIIGELGLPIAHTEMAAFAGRKVLVVKRFDRRWQGIDRGAEEKARFKAPAEAWIARIPQEDFCQALGAAPDQKYQSQGGPGISECLQLLTASENRDDDRALFALAQLAFWMLAATDGHAKNFSIYHRRGGSFGLTPLYDVLSAWPIIGDGPANVSYQRARLAMAVRGERNMHYRLRDIQLRHWQRLAAICGPDVWGRMVAMAQTVPDMLDRVEHRLPDAFPQHTWHAINAGMRRHADQFMRQVG